MQSLSDRELVERTRGGHRDAFGYLVDRYQDPLFRYVLHLGFAEDDARDILQDAFVRAFRHLDRCGDPDRFDGWLFKITANLCRTQGRKTSKRTMTSLEQVTLKEDRPGPDRVAEAHSAQERIRQVLEILPEDQREAVVLFYMQGLGVTEIAEVQGASRSAVKMRLKRARERLREQLEPLRDEVGES
jgi:RNA polymerase sigma-70 factor (ECF subfamily)